MENENERTQEEHDIEQEENEAMGTSGFDEYNDDDSGEVETL